HYGTRPLPGFADEAFADPAFARFPRGYADTLADRLYDDLHDTGCHLLLAPYSRLFVDLNRPRDDFEVVAGAVRSERGVFKTHFRGGLQIFARPLSPRAAERRLREIYDPYHRSLRAQLRELRQRHGRVVLIDGHTGSPRKLAGHQVVIGTRRHVTSRRALNERLGQCFSDHGFEVSFDVSGYAGGHTVCTYGQPREGVDAVQIEVNAGLLLNSSFEEFMAARRAGREIKVHRRNMERLRVCLREVLVEAAREAEGQIDGS
ncbi:MAG: N-formylglutamate amidohydrolase, partial [Gammaproteobacteria bacterium]|nr:N-formylglutamate amidohydrolase [Gammaproteobacteria bacterium]